MVSDSLKEASFEPKKVANGGKRQIHHEGRRSDPKHVVCAEEWQLLAVDGEKCQEKDVILLKDEGYYFCISVRRRPSYPVSWAQSEY